MGVLGENSLCLVSISSVLETLGFEVSIDARRRSVTLPRCRTLFDLTRDGGSSGRMSVKIIVCGGFTRRRGFADVQMACFVCSV